MSERTELVKLLDGTLIRHNVAGYEGRIDGTTEIKSLFTEAGELLEKPGTKQSFQYRVVVAGESMRRIAPAEDLEVLEGVVEVDCLRCHYLFRSKPGFADKPGGRCQCGAWICPSCLGCRSAGMEASQDGPPSCTKERKRLIRKAAAQKKRTRG